ncbi:MAG: S8 family serine peptidase, partial [Bacteroidota bacterium]
MKFDSSIFKTAYLAVLLTFTLSSCMQEDLLDGGPETIKVSPAQSNNTTNTTTNNNNTIISTTQIVVRYKDPNITEPQKQAIRAAKQELYQFIITNVETCNCDLKDLELWTIDTSHPNFIGIEDVLKNMENDEDEGDMVGNHQFFFNLTTVETPCTEVKEGITSWLAPSNPDEINIAIIDTGIDYNFLPRPLLHGSSNDQTCIDEITGWDFVNNDNDPMDDHYHGTLVSQVVIKSMDAHNVPFQLIPLKAFNDKGRGDYFNVACAIRYILEKGDVDIVNMSFGWDEVRYASIMKQMMDEMSESTLFVASAGNNGRNTDHQGDGHFPSSYESSNMLTVAGYSPRSGPL